MSFDFITDKSLDFEDSHSCRLQRHLQNPANDELYDYVVQPDSPTPDPRHQ